MKLSPPTKKPPFVEYALTIPIAAGFIYTIWYLLHFGYLPQPYFYEPSGVFMDFFATSTFAQTGGAFDTFQTIYPPLTFALLKFISWAPCYDSNSFEWVRDCDIYGISWLVIFYIINAILITLSYLKIDRRTAIPRAFALSAGLPMTYALERGNVLLMCLTCIILAYGPLIRSARARWIFAGLAVNFKVYLIGTVFAQLLHRKWRWFEGAILATLVVYLVTYAIYGEGTPKEIFTNIRNYAGGFQASTVLDLWYPSSFVPLKGLLEGTTFPILNTVDEQLVTWGLLAVRALMAGAMASVVIAAAAAWWRPSVVPMHRLIFLSIGIAIISSEVGGYTHMLLLFFVFMESWRGVGRRLAIVIAYILCIAIEIPLEYVPPVVRDSYLGGRDVIAQYSVGLGSFARPILLHVMIVTLALVTVRDVWADIRQNGWRERYRYAPSSAADDSRAAPTAA